jgi:hypothetical protein
MTGDISIADGKPSSSEWLVMFLLLGGLLVLHLATYNLYPAVWCDEVSFAEPAANLVTYGSFTTLVWQHQPLNTFPTVNCPLYPMLLVPWLWVFGPSLLAVRALNYALMTLAAFLVWVVTWRFSIIRVPWLRVITIVTLCLGYGMSYAYRTSRPDILGFVLLLLLILSFSIHKRRWRALALVTAAAATVWVGLQVALYAGSGAFLAWALGVRSPFSPAVGRSLTPEGGGRAVSFSELVLIGCGFSAGAGALALFLHWHGVLPYLLAIVVGMGGKHYAHAQAGAFEPLIKVIQKTRAAYFAEFSTVIIVLGLSVLLVGYWRRLSTSTLRFVLFCLVLTFGTPLLFNVAGHYAFYYSHMVYVPALLAIVVTYACVSREEERKFEGRRLTNLFAVLILFGTLTASALVGLPMRLGIALTCFDLVPRGLIAEQVKSHVRPGDVVFSDYTAFFEVKRITPIVYDLWSSEDLMPTHIPGRVFTEEQKSDVNVMVIRPEASEKLTNYFGGSWIAQTPPFGDRQDFSVLLRLPLVGTKFARHAAQPQTARFPLQIFRRVENIQDKPKTPALP